MAMCLSLLVCLAGCGSDDTANSGAGEGVDGNVDGSTDGVGTTGSGTGSQPGALVVIHAVAPEGFVGDFAFDDVTIADTPSFTFCRSAGFCETNWDPETHAVTPMESTDCAQGDCYPFNMDGDKLTVWFLCPDHLFVPIKINAASHAGTDPIEIAWDFPGAWGLAPNGTYRDSEDGEKYDVTTKYSSEHGGIILLQTGLLIGIVGGDAFAWQADSGTTYEGTISSDLTTISYHETKSSGKEFDTILFRVE